MRNKIIAAILSLIYLATLAACANTEGNQSDTPAPSNSDYEVTLQENNQNSESAVAAGNADSAATGEDVIQTQPVQEELTAAEGSDFSEKKALSFFGEQKSLTFKSTQKTGDGLHTIYTYLDDKGNEFSFTPDTNSFSAFIQEANRKNYVEGSTDSSRATADKYLNAILSSVIPQIAPGKSAVKSNYQLTKESYGEYTKLKSYSYTRKIGDIETTEFISVNLGEDGSLASCVISKIGAFDNVSATLDEAKIAKQTQSELKKKFSSKYIDHKIENRYYDLQNGQLILKVNAAASFKEGDTVLSSGETLSFVIK